MTTPQNLPTEPRQAIEELTMILLYLTRFAWDKNQEMRSNWKSYDWDAMDHLVEQEFLYRGSRKNKSVDIMDTGVQKAQELLKKYNIKDWES